MSISKEQGLIERAGVIIKNNEGHQDPSSLDRLCAEYNAIVDELYAVRMPPKDTFALLPAELKYRIFEEFCSSTEGGPLLLSQVCKQWLQLTRQNSELWTKITIIPTESQWLKHLKLYSRLSGERMLDVTICFPLTEEDIQKIEVSTNFSRWRSLSVIKGRSSPDHMLASARMLLRLSGSSRLVSLLRRDPFPHLNDIDIQIMSPITSSPYLWSNLFETDDLAAIVSDFTKSTLLSHLTVNLKFTGFDHLLQTLSNSPNLTYLKLSAQRRDAEQISGPVGTKTIPLDKLRELRMENNGLDLLLAIECPELEILSSSIVFREIQTFRMRLLTFTSLRKLALTVRRPYVGGSLPTTLKGQHLPLTALRDLTLGYLPGTGLNGSSLNMDHEDVYQLLELFPEARRVKLVSGMETFDWPRVIETFSKVEQLKIEQARNDSISRNNHAYQDFLSFRPPLSFIQNVPDLTSLVSLRVSGGACNAALCAFSASRLQSLVMAETKELSIDIFLAFIARSPALYKLHLEGIYVVIPSIKDSPLSIEPLNFEEATTITSSIQDLHIMHDALPILQRLSLPYLHTLRLMGVLQGIFVHRENYHFDQREIHLSDLLDHPGYPLHNLTTLDLCAANALFPVIVGLTDILPYLVSLKSISLPRVLQETDVLVDVLIEEMLKENAGVYICPRMRDIQTEDYPQWDKLMDLLSRRNRTAHIKRDDSTQTPVPVPIECLRLPGLPHSSVLNPLQVVLAGKFPPRQEEDTAEATSAQGCDDCALTGWNCLEQPVDKGAHIRSSCSRHRDGPVRVTADS